MLKPLRLRKRNFTMVTCRKPGAADGLGNCGKSICLDNRKVLSGSKYSIGNSLLASKMTDAKLDRIETIRMPDSHPNPGGLSAANVAEKLQTIKIVVWAI
jgi:hypothetical protein